jgi:hypothetical protein
MPKAHTVLVTLRDALLYKEIMYVIGRKSLVQYKPWDDLARNAFIRLTHDKSKEKAGIIFDTIENACRKNPASSRSYHVMDIEVLRRLGILNGDAYEVARLFSEKKHSIKNESGVLMLHNITGSKDDLLRRKGYDTYFPSIAGDLKYAFDDCAFYWHLQPSEKIVSKEPLSKKGVRKILTFEKEMKTLGGDFCTDIKGTLPNHAAIEEALLPKEKIREMFAALSKVATVQEIRVMSSRPINLFMQDMGLFDEAQPS